MAPNADDPRVENPFDPSRGGYVPGTVLFICLMVYLKIISPHSGEDALSAYISKPLPKWLISSTYIGGMSLCLVVSSDVAATALAIHTWTQGSGIISILSFIDWWNN